MLETTLNLYSNFVPVLESINNALGSVIDSADDVKNATGLMLDEASLENARASLEMNEGIIKNMRPLIDDNSDAQKEHNRQLDRGVGKADSLFRTVKHLAAAYLGIRGMKLFTDTADDYINVRTRMKNVLEGFGDSAKYTTNTFEQAVFQSAQRARADYAMVGDVITKMGMQARNAFNNPDELIGFSEQLSKNFKIAGTDAEGVRSVMYNLTQAMASGVLRGQDLNSVMANAPIIAQRAAEYLGRDISEVRKLAEEGKLTADVIKNAMLASADETNEAFASMPKTLADIKTRVKNIFRDSMSGSFIKWNEFLQTEDFTRFTEYIITGLGYVSDGLMWIVETVVTVGNVISENSDIVVPILYGVAAALGVWAVATWGMTAAQWALNAALDASPIGWILVLIGLLVGGTVAWVRSVGGVEIAWLKVTGAFKSTYSYIVGSFDDFVGKAEIAALNTKLFLYSLFIALKTGAYGTGVFILEIIQDTVNIAVDGINLIISALNKIPGVNIGEAGRFDFADKLNEKRRAIASADRQEIGDMARDILKRDAGRAAHSRAMWAEYGQERADREAEIERIKKANEEQATQLKSDLGYGGSLKFDGIDSLKEGLDGIGSDTKGIRDSLGDGVKIKDEDIEAIRDVMFNRSIAGMTSSPIHVHVDNKFGDIHETADLDSWMAGLEDGIAQAIATVGVS